MTKNRTVLSAMRRRRATIKAKSSQVSVNKNKKVDYKTYDF